MSDDEELRMINVQQVLAKHNILSTPVYDGDKCIGLVDVLDFAKFVRELYFANKETSQFKNYLLQFSFEMEKVESVIGTYINLIIIYFVY